MHSHVSTSGNSQNQDTASITATIPFELMKGMRVVLKAVIGIVTSYATGAHTPLLLYYLYYSLLLFTTGVVRGFDAFENNEFVQLQKEDPQKLIQDPLVGKVHNDDVHTFQHVINALLAIGKSSEEATRITNQIDGDGDALILTSDDVTSTNQGSLYDAHRKLALEGKLMFSTVSESVASLEQRLVSSYNWLLSVGAISDGMRRVVVEAMLLNVETGFAPTISASLYPLRTSSTMPPPPPSSSFTTTTITTPTTALHLSLPSLFNNPRLFPYTVLLSRSQCPETLPTAPLTHPTFHNPNPSPSSTSSTSSDYGGTFKDHIIHPLKSRELRTPLGILVSLV